VIEATVEENVQRLSGQRAAAMDLSAAVGSRVKQVGQQEPLTVRWVIATGHHESHMELHTFACMIRMMCIPMFSLNAIKCTSMCHAVHTGIDDMCTFCHHDQCSSMHAQGCCFAATTKLDRSSQRACLTSTYVDNLAVSGCIWLVAVLVYHIRSLCIFLLYNLCTNSRDGSHVY